MPKYLMELHYLLKLKKNKYVSRGFIKQDNAKLYNSFVLSFKDL